jgi:hypothetical protein
MKLGNPDTESRDRPRDSHRRRARERGGCRLAAPETIEAEKPLSP